MYKGIDSKKSSYYPSLNLHRVLGPFLHFEAISVSSKRFMSYYPKHYAAEGAIYIESKYWEHQSWTSLMYIFKARKTNDLFYTEIEIILFNKILCQNLPMKRYIS